MDQIQTKEGLKTLINVTKDNFICPKGEERSYHCLLEQEHKRYSESTGAYIGAVRLQAFGKKFIEHGGIHHLRSLGYRVTILHDPNEWIKANAERIEAEKAARAKAAKEAAEKRQREEDEAKEAAMTEKIMAKLRAEGWAPKKESKPAAKK